MRVGRTRIAALARPAPAPIRWLSRESLWLYLLHFPILDALVRHAERWPSLLRIVFATAVTLAISAVAIECGRAVQRAVNARRLILNPAREP